MALESLQILGYRGFKAQGDLSFAKPNGGEGSGLTVITGANNSGKSTILECLRARGGYQAPSFTQGARNRAVDSVKIVYRINANDEVLESVRKGSSETRRSNRDENFEVFVLPSRRAFEPYFSRSVLDRTNLMHNSGLQPQRSAQLTQFSGRLFKVLDDPEGFNRILARVLGYQPEWSIDQTDQSAYYLKFFNAGDSHSSDGMGEGVVSVFAIVDALYDSKAGNMVVIDEPELSLHPALQKRLSQVLCEYAKDRQIVISTHSPYFVELQAIKNGAHLARVTTGAQGTKIHQLTEKSKKAITALASGNIYNPHVFGLDAKELFFQDDRIILTEGQEDVVVLPNIARQLGKEFAGSFFGWGAGGAGNIQHVCDVLSDLGYTKVAGILDADKTADRDMLAGKFPGYYFSCIPAKDVRDKPRREATDAVEGLSDSKMNVKDQFKDEMSDIIARLNASLET